MKIKPRKERIFFILIFLVFFVIIYLESRSKVTFNDPKTKTQTQCKINLENINNDDEIMKFNENIYFIDSHNETENVIVNARKACNIEAAALLNPDHTIYIIFLSHNKKISNHHSNFSAALTSYENIQFRFMNVKDFCKGTELEDWMESNPMTKYSIDQIADVMKYLAAYKYGGTFMDFNTLSIRSLDEIDHPNFACLDGHFSIYDGIFKLDRKYGNKFALGFFERLKKSFKLLPLSSGENVSKFTTNLKHPKDPHQLFSDMIRLSCPNSIINDTTTINCDDFFLLPASACAPKLRKNQKKIFNENRSKFVLSKIEKSFFIKILLDELQTGKLRTQSRSAYSRLARKFCPKIVNAAGKYI